MENLLSILLLCNNLATFDYQSFEFEGLVSDNSNHKWHIETRYLILNSKYAAFIWNSRCVVAKKKAPEMSLRLFWQPLLVDEERFQQMRSETHHLSTKWNPPPSTKWNPPPSCRDPNHRHPEGRTLPGYGEEGLNSQPPYVLKPNFLSKFWTKIEKYCKPLSGFRKSC